MTLADLRPSITLLPFDEAVTLIGVIRSARRAPKLIKSPKVAKAKKENDNLRAMIANLTQDEISNLLNVLNGDENE